MNKVEYVLFKTNKKDVLTIDQLKKTN